MKAVLILGIIMFIGFVALTIYVTSKAYSHKDKE